MISLILERCLILAHTPVRSPWREVMPCVVCVSADQAVCAALLVHEHDVAIIDGIQL